MCSSDLGVEVYKVIETLLIVSMAAFNLSVVPWGSWTNRFLFNSDAFTKAIKWMYTVVILGICKFKTIIGLNDLGFVSDQAFHRRNRLLGHI